MRCLGALAAALVLALPGCGGGDDALRVGAAASLREALAPCAGDAVISFAGSDDLAAQIRQGADLDVLAAANTTLPQALHDDGLLEAPVVFATNELVLATPADGRVRRVADLRDPSVSLVVGAPAVPVGAYTREAIVALGEKVRARVRSEEPDVRGVVAKLAQRAADAGFVYRTDVKAAGGRLRAIALPARARPEVRYGAAVVRRTDQADRARRFVDGLRDGPCAERLRAAGFGAP